MCKSSVMKVSPANIQRTVASFSYTEQVVEKLVLEMDAHEIYETKRPSFQTEVDRLVHKLNQIYGHTWASLTATKVLRGWENQLLPQEEVASKKIQQSLDKFGAYYVSSGDIFAFRDTDQ